MTEVLGFEMVRSKIHSSMTFESLPSATRCDGSDCLMEKVEHHQENHARHCYHSFLLQQYVKQVPIEGAHVRRGYLLVHPEPEKCWVGYCDLMKSSQDENDLPIVVVLHVEVVAAHGGEYNNFLAVVDPKQLSAVVVGVFAPRCAFSSVPWNAILEKQPWGGKPAGGSSMLRLLTPPRVQLLNEGESKNGNPFRYLMMIHGVLSLVGANQRADVVQSLIQIPEEEAKQREENRIVGAAMYELHLLDTFVPRRADALDAELQKFRERRVEMMAQTPERCLFVVSTAAAVSESTRVTQSWMMEG